MYAIIRTGGKQAKVRAGDVIDVERLREEDEVTFTPLLVVGDDGTVISGRDELADVKVVAKVLGPSAGPKVDIFKYKAKTGYRRRQGHRQKYTRIEVTDIEVPSAGKKAIKPKAKAEAKPEAKEPKAEAKPEAKAEAKEPKTEAKPEAKPEAKAEATEPKTEAQPEAKAEAKAEAKPEAKEPKAEAKPEAKPEAKKPKAKPKAADTESAAGDDAAGEEE